MKALTFWGAGDVRVEDVAEPELIDAHSALITVTRAGICGSDLHPYRGHGFSEDRGFCLGHEAVGVVEEVGSAVQRYRPGDRVLVAASVGCTRCEPCARGTTSMCLTRHGALEKCYGLSFRLQGTQTERAAIPDADRNLFAIPDGVSDDTAVVLTDAAPTAWYGCRRARIEPGDTVAVIGMGPIGLMAAQQAHIMGASEVFGTDPVPERRALAESLGITAIDSADAVAEIRARTGGEGTQVAIEAVGADATVEDAMRIVRRTGRVSVIGVNQNKRYSFHMERAQVKELEFAIGLCSVQRELPTLLELTRTGRLAPETVISHRLSLDEGPEGYRLLDSREAGVSKVVFTP